MGSSLKLGSVCKEIFGITPRRYRQLASDGIVPPVTKGEIDFLEAVKKMIQYYREQAATPSLIEARQENISLKNNLLELEYLVESKKLISKEEISAEFVFRIQMVKQGLLSLHRMLPGQLVGKDPREMSDIIRRAAIQLLERFSRKSGLLKEVRVEKAKR